MSFGNHITFDYMMLSSAACADKASYKKQLEEALKLEEARVSNIEAASGHDEALAKEITQLATEKMASAERYTAQAKAFTDAAAGSSGPEKADLDAFAKEMQAYAGYDRKFADERKKAADILEKQRAEMAQGLPTHKAEIDRIKAKLAALK